MKDYQYAFIEEILVHLALQVVVENKVEKILQW